MQMAVPLSDDGSRGARRPPTHMVSESFVQHRYSMIPMECRGIVAHWEPFDQRLDVWMSSQNPHEARLAFSRATGVPENKIRVQIGDVGGGFGLKSFVGREEIVIVIAAHDARRGDQVERGPAREPHRVRPRTPGEVRRHPARRRRR